MSKITIGKLDRGDEDRVWFTVNTQFDVRIVSESNDLIRIDVFQHDAFDPIASLVAEIEPDA